MPILTPNNFKIIVPDLANVDQTAEPTVEVETATDYLGNAVAAGEQAINVMDGYPERPVQVDTDGSSATWRFDMALTKRRTYDAFVVDGHNLRSAYPLALRDMIHILAHTSDAVGSATEVVYSKIMSGLLGKGRPRLKYDGIASKTTVADSAHLDFDNGDGSIEFIVSITDTSSDAWFFGRREDGSNILYGFYDVSESRLDFNYFIGGGLKAHIRVTWTPTENRDYHIIWGIDNGDANAVYINGVSQTLAAEDHTGGDLELTADLTWGHYNANYGKIDMKLGRLWNRFLSEAEALVLYNGWTHTPIPVADRYGSQTAIYTSDFTAGTDNWAVARGGISGNIDGISDGVDSEENTLRFFADANPSLRHIFHTGTNDPFTVGLRYRVTFDAYVGKDGGGANTSCDGFALIFSHNSSHDFADGFGLSGSGNGSAGAWTSYIAESDALGTDFMIVALDGADDTWVGQNVNTDDLIYIKNVVITRVGCVAEYSHDGIDKEAGKWEDASGNDLSGTITGCEYLDCPDDDDLGFYLMEFTDVVDKLWWFLNIIQSGQGNARDDSYVGLAAPCKVYEFNIKATGGYAAEFGYPGVRTRRTANARTLAEQYYGRLDSFEITLAPMTESEFGDFQEFQDRVEGARFPFYCIFNDGDADKVVRRLRMAGLPKLQIESGSLKPFNVSLPLMEDTDEV